MSCGFFSEKSICQRITNDRKKATYVQTRVVKTNNRFSVFSFCNKKTNKRFDRISKTVGDERSKF